MLPKSFKVYMSIFRPSFRRIIVSSLSLSLHVGSPI